MHRLIICLKTKVSIDILNMNLSHSYPININISNPPNNPLPPLNLNLTPDIPHQFLHNPSHNSHSLLYPLAPQQKPRNKTPPPLFFALQTFER